jgi:carboxypeptidase Taq
MHRIADLSAASSVLGWDQETYMPSGAVAARAEQLSTLSSLQHQIMTGEDTRRLVETIDGWLGELPDRQQRMIQTFVRDHERALRLPPSFVAEMAKVAALAQDSWKRSRTASDFSIFQPMLERIIDLKRQESAFHGTAAHPYDNLLDEYEPGLTVAALTPVFDALREGTTNLLARITSSGSPVNDVVLYRRYERNAQLEFATHIIQQLGFSLETGRVDLSAHPFCTSFDSSDVRLTTRIRENDLRSCLFGLIHEAGHGMYEQGISRELSRTSSGSGASMGIHESQSLFWENVIARSREFWHWAFPQLRDRFPEQLADQTEDTFFRAINRMQPSLNRVESDELTYNLHIILRFELERDLVAGTVAVKDVPTIWNEKMQASLGVIPPNDAEGCLQDVHWSFGGVGYFPSYTLGKLYAAMEWNALKAEMPGVQDRIANGDFAPIREWLQVKIHDCGRTELPTEIIQRVCGRPLTHEDFLSYVGAKAEDVYAL